MRTRRTLTCTSVTSVYRQTWRDQRERERERKRNIISLTWAEQIRTSCRSRTRSGPLTLGARAIISPWAEKVKVVLSLGFVGLKEPPTKQPNWSRFSYLARPRSHSHQGLMYIHTMFGYRKGLEGLQGGTPRGGATAQTPPIGRVSGLFNLC